MIDRGNWHLVRDFLRYRREVDQVSDGTANLEWRWLRHLLEWADDRGFKDAPMIRPTFPVFVLSARSDGIEKPLSDAYVKKLVGVARRFLAWLSTHKPGYRILSPAWLDTLKAPRVSEEPREHEGVTLDEVMAMIQAPTVTARERRIRAAAAFWFLSGIRVGAFVSLPVGAVDLQKGLIRQWPSLGVNTKFGKHETTYLLDIPQLLTVARAWDDEVRARVGDSGLWFAHLSPDIDELVPSGVEPGKHRDSRARKDLKDWLARVGLPYHSPHKFRHGHAVYALKRAKDMADLKAISQNLMHANIQVTDGIYSILSGSDVRTRIAELGKEETASGFTSPEVLDRLADLLVERITAKIAGHKKTS